ncbi:hypothetical protein COU53_00910 [Candidatus Pacearchaeota archaeon CG10_big_fil_rev_8_21_14_0_10_30_48]|nr:MAG: hypothetical protein COU53_00910 [Candidatus Pacearchaeota archaeon CG10_big_fil_rev_8_21_14_0_10_30_48]
MLIGFIIVLVVIAGLAYFLTRQGSGSLILQITDAPSDLNISKALVTISKVQVHASGDNTTEAEWITIVDNAQTFDLIAIKDVKTFLGSTNLSEGKYTQIRLSVDSAAVTINGIDQTLEIPSKVVKLIHPFTISADKDVILTLDFNAQESIRSTGKDKYIMNPTIKVLVE